MPCGAITRTRHRRCKESVDDGPCRYHRTLKCECGQTMVAGRDHVCRARDRPEGEPAGDIETAIDSLAAPSWFRQDTVDLTVDLTVP